MLKFKLSQEELQELSAAHKQAKSKSSASTAYKINAVILLGSGWTLEQTKAALLLDTETLRKYVNKYKTGGVKELTATFYVGKTSLLSDSQKKQLVKHLEQNLYRTTVEIIDYVKSTFNVSYQPSGMKNLLHKLGFSYKKPKLVPCKLDPTEQEDFIELYRGFMDKKPADEAVIFYDASHPQHMTTCDYGWIKKGTEFPILNNVGRSRLNISGGIDIETLDVVLDTPDKVNGETTIELFKKIEAAYPNYSKVHIILDNAAYHKSKLVTEYAANSKINLVFLPAYSPNLNPIERLWRYLRDEVLSNKFYKTFPEFKNSCTDFLKSLPDKKDKLASLITDEFQDLGILINT